jgi:hypothetical protein
VSIRTPSGIWAQLASVVELEDVVLALASRRARVRGQDELDALTAQHFAERLTERRRLAPEHVLGHVGHRHLAAESTNGLRHLHADRPATEDQQTAGNGLHGGHLAVAPNAVQLAQARHGRHDRIGTVRENHMIRGMAHTVDLHDPRAGEPPAAAQQLDAAIGKEALLASVGVFGDDEVTPGERRLNIDLGARGGLARAMDRLTRPQQRLRRNASSIGALSSHELPLYDRHTQTALRQSARAMLARGAATEHDHVIVAVHLSSFSQRPGSRVVISWSSQPLPSGSLNAANEL